MNLGMYTINKLLAVGSLVRFLFTRCEKKSYALTNRKITYEYIYIYIYYTSIAQKVDG